LAPCPPPRRKTAPTFDPTAQTISRHRSRRCG
jgi:hypothetical protein